MITNDDIIRLTALVRQRLSENRFSHTLGVMRAAEMLGNYCLSDKIDELKVAALLHDIAKELPLDEQKALILGGGGTLTEEDISCAPVIHSFAAPYVVKKDFSDFAIGEVLSAIRFHTTGDASMSVFDEIVFLADFIEDTRPYKACKELREELISGLVQDKIEENQQHLHRMSIKMIDFTVKYLSDRQRPVHSSMYAARKMLERKLF